MSKDSSEADVVDLKFVRAVLEALQEVYVFTGDTGWLWQFLQQFGSEQRDVVLQIKLSQEYRTHIAGPFQYLFRTLAIEDPRRREIGGA
jgi:hypothetical protein